jgi:phosphotriesterase-related protein
VAQLVARIRETIGELRDWEKSTMQISSQLTRRQAIQLLGIGTGVGVFCAVTDHFDVVDAFQIAGGARRPLAGVPTGAIIRTILKDVPPEALGGGATLFHEHMSMNNTFLEKVVRELPPETAQRLYDPSKPYFMEDLALMTDEMRGALKDGVACLVDAGTADQGRSVAFLRQLSQNSGMPIVVSGGYYLQMTYSPETIRSSEDQLAGTLVRDANAERWGAFGEIGTSAVMTFDEHKVLRAVGKAHLRTNIPIFTHTSNGKMALEQLDLFEAVGVKPEHVVIGHLSRVDDSKANLHREIARRGAFCGFDGSGSSMEVDAKQVPMIQAMIDAGYTERVLLSSDFNTDVRTLKDLKKNGGLGYARAVAQMTPLLQKAGVSEQAIRTITIDNPRRFLAFVPQNV